MSTLVLLLSMASGPDLRGRGLQLGLGGVSPHPTSHSPKGVRKRQTAKML